MMCDCVAVASFAEQAKDSGISFRFSVLLITLTLVTFVHACIESKLRKCTGYKHISPDVALFLRYRAAAAIFSIPKICGYIFLLYQTASGCNANSLYLFFFFGPIEAFHDLHELIRRWPLGACDLFLHHVGVIICTVSLIDFRLYPRPGEQVDPLIVFLLSNIGLAELGHMFAPMFRLSMNKGRVKLAARFYYAVQYVKLVNIPVMIVMLTRSATKGDLVLCMMAVLIGGPNYLSFPKSFRFAYRFDVDQYFAAHQATWGAVDEEKGVDGRQGAATTSDGNVAACSTE